MNEDETRELYVEYRTLTEQLQQIQQYLQETGENMGEVANVIAALDEFSRLNTNDKIFAPIANGIFIDARLTDPQTVRMNVGGGWSSRRASQRRSRSSQGSARNSTSSKRERQPTRRRSSPGSARSSRPSRRRP